MALIAADGGSGLDATAYSIQIARNTGFTIGLQESGWDADGSWVPSALWNGTTYYWRVKARDVLLNETGYYGNVDEAGYHSFTTSGSPPVPFFPHAAFILFGALITIVTVLYLRRKRALA